MGVGGLQTQVIFLIIMIWFWRKHSTAIKLLISQRSKQTWFSQRFIRHSIPSIRTWQGLAPIFLLSCLSFVQALKLLQILHDRDEPVPSLSLRALLLLPAEELVLGDRGTFCLRPGLGTIVRREHIFSLLLFSFLQVIIQLFPLI